MIKSEVTNLSTLPFNWAIKSAFSIASPSLDSIHGQREVLVTVYINPSNQKVFFITLIKPSTKE
jgi:hypothetical protein